MTQQSRPPLYGSGARTAELRDAFTSGEFTVAVYGLGKMGLPLATVFAPVAKDVVGVDIDEAVVNAVSAGECPVTGEPGLPTELAREVEVGHLHTTTKGTQAAEAARLHVVIVPTLVEDGEPDLSALDAVTETIAAGIEPGDMVVVESTVPPGTCRDRVFLELNRETGYSLGDFGLAFCPERTMSGRALKDIRGSHPKVIGGADAESRRIAETIYSEITSADLVPVADCTTAECVKVFEGLYRDVNIALANELATLVDELGVDVTAAIEAANTQPFCDIHDPGPGVGGHCIPYYPYFVTSRVEKPTPLLETARDVNDAMPQFTVERVADCLQATGCDLNDSAVVVLGLTYRPGVDEIQASPGIEVAARLTRRAHEVYACDPIFSDSPPEGVRRIGLDKMSELDVDAVVLMTPHEEFDDIEWDALDAVIIDGHRTLDPDRFNHYYAIGRGHTEVASSDF